MWWGGYHWWWPGLVLMCVGMLACVAVMALMMGHGRMPGMGGMCGFWQRNHSRAHQTGTPVQVLEERLARGEIDIGEYLRRLDTGQHETGTPVQVLEERLARGEIDINEYRRIRQTLAKVNSPADSEEHAGSPL